MLTNFVYSIKYAFLTFPIAAFAFTFPFLLVQYRRHGYVHKYRAWLLYLFLLYMMNAFYLILLPLPSSVHNEPPANNAYFQLIPFHFVLDILKETAVEWSKPFTYFRLLKEFSSLQVVFNVLLTIPFGMFLRYYFRTGWLACLLYSFALSLFFETTQLTAIFGLFDYPYRLFDVDDLMTNTAGGMLGFLAAAWLSSRLPRIDRLNDDVDLSTKRVSYTRRGLAFLIDWFIVTPVIAIFTVLHMPVAYLIAVALYFVLLPYYWKGQTIGKALVRIRLQGSGDRLTLRELSIRYGLLYGVVGGLNVLALVLGARREIDAVFLLPLLFALFILNVSFGIHLIRCVFNRHKRLFYERRSGTDHVISMRTGRIRDSAGK